MRNIAILKAGELAEHVVFQAVAARVIGVCYQWLQLYRKVKQ